MKPKKPKPDNPAQSKRFIDAAKALEADGGLSPTEADERFKRALKAMGKPKGPM